MKDQRKEIEQIIKNTFEGSFDKVELMPRGVQSENENDAVLMIHCSKGDNTYPFQYTYTELIQLHANKILTKELLRVKDRVLKESL
jgi:hypothetical protein